VVDFIDYNMVLDMIGGRRAYKRFLHDGLKDGLRDISKNVQFQTILGGDEFVAMVKSKYLEKGSLHEQPTYRGMVLQPMEPTIVITHCAEVMGVSVNQITTRSSDGIIRGIVADMLYRFSGIPQRMIGKLLGGIGYTAVNMLRCRLHDRMSDPAVYDRYDRVERRLRHFCEL
jgi:hypothetical protein